MKRLLTWFGCSIVDGWCWLFETFIEAAPELDDDPLDRFGCDCAMCRDFQADDRLNPSWKAWSPAAHTDVN